MEEAAAARLPHPALLLAVLPRKRRRRKPRKRVRDSIRLLLSSVRRLTPIAEKEESDDDMGFGLFD